MNDIKVLFTKTEYLGLDLFLAIVFSVLLLAIIVCLIKEADLIEKLSEFTSGAIVIVLIVSLYLPIHFFCSRETVYYIDKKDVKHVDDIKYQIVLIKENVAKVIKR